ncbi:AAA family ATPase [Burkholderia cepacia]|uniref:AAA family ATPase n=1 Tax=Burkholderia cepacia TaxID=292 RepID=UPI001CF3D74B|nr:AAA family ATPase [Burkholderia cepacia]MCA8323129.1 AAA family ATPase [Burkholderia cepacia]
MKVRKIRLQNGYKRFHDLTIDLGDSPAKIIALVGLNGSGKSSVLDGLLFHHNIWSTIGNTGRKDFKYHSMREDPGFDYNNVTIEFSEGDYQSARQRRKGRENTIFSFRSPYRYNSDLDVKNVEAVQDIIKNNYGASVTSAIDSKMLVNYRRLNVRYTAYMYEADCKPSEARQKIIGDLNESLNKCLNLEIDNLGDIESGKGTLFFKKPDHPNSFPFNVLSSGEKEVVDLLLDLYLRSEEYTDTVFLLDEPELHINTSIQKNLLLEMNRLIGDNCQLWIATHSIGFLRALQENLRDDCQLIYFDDTYNLAAKPYTLKPSPKNSNTWRKIFGVALDDLAHLISPQRIVYCEGRDTPGENGKERGMDANAYNNIFNKKYPDTLFVSSGGNTELDQRSAVAISILSKAIPSVEIFVLKDRDSGSGAPVSSDERDLYLRNNPENHRMLDRWEIENYLFDKEVLLEYCKKNDLKFDEQAYDSFVTDIENQDVKAMASKIRSICNIKTNINAEVFKLRLAEVFNEDMQVYRQLESCIFHAKIC